MSGKRLRPDLHLALLSAFYGAAGQAVGVSDLKQDLGLELEEIAAEVEKLRSAGYVIGKSHPYGSTAFTLLEVPDRFYEHEVSRRVTTSWLGRTIECYDSVPSTNELARERAAEGAAAGAVVLAEAQTAGRGRAGRSWYSAPGKGIYLSLVLRPGSAGGSLAALQVATAVAVAHTAMKITGRAARLRWPNDVMMEGGKLAGILAEATFAGGGEPALVVGIGLNVSHGPGDFPEDLGEPATSLALETGHHVSRLPVLPTLLSTLEEWYDSVFAGEMEKIAAAWRPLSTLLDREVRLRRGEEERTGTVRDLSPEKGILLAAGGNEEWIPAEHVTFLRPRDEDDPGVTGP